MNFRRAFLCSLFIAVFIAAGAHAGQVAGVGKPAPDFTLTAQSSDVHTLSNHQGKVVLLMIIGYG